MHDRHLVPSQLANLLSFRGQDLSQLFWPYSLLVGAALVVAWIVAAQSIVQGAIASVVLETASPSVVSTIVPFYLGWVVAAVALLGAATTRRLRDANKSPAWGILPIVGATANALFITEAFSNDEVMNPLFFGTFGVTLFTAVSLITLVVKLNAPTIRP